jgi:hypothetical protein
VVAVLLKISVLIRLNSGSQKIQHLPVGPVNRPPVGFGVAVYHAHFFVHVIKAFMYGIFVNSYAILGESCPRMPGGIKR